MTAPGFCQCGCGLTVKIARRTDSRHGIVRGKPQRFIHGHQRRGVPGPNKGGSVVQLHPGRTKLSPAERAALRERLRRVIFAGLLEIAAAR